MEETALLGVRVPRTNAQRPSPAVFPRFAPRAAPPLCSDWTEAVRATCCWSKRLCGGVSSGGGAGLVRSGAKITTGGGGGSVGSE